MAKVNKTHMVLDAMVNWPGSSPKELADLLLGQGVMVTAGYISNIKTRLRKEEMKSRANADSVCVADLLEVKAFVDRHGLEEARRAVECVSQLV